MDLWKTDINDDKMSKIHPYPFIFFFLLTLIFLAKFNMLFQIKAVWFSRRSMIDCSGSWLDWFFLLDGCLKITNRGQPSPLNYFDTDILGMFLSVNVPFLLEALLTIPYAVWLRNKYVWGAWREFLENLHWVQFCCMKMIGSEWSQNVLERLLMERTQTTKQQP